MLSIAVLLMMVVAGAGCASRKKPMDEWAAKEKYRDYVPETAKPVAEGTGIISFKAREVGTVYVIDINEQVVIKDAAFPRVLGSWLARQDETIVFDPINAKFGPAGTEGLRISKVNAQHTHQLRFDPTEKDK
jgi:hypothetical protein